VSSADKLTPEQVEAVVHGTTQLTETDLRMMADRAQPEIERLQQIAADEKRPFAERRHAGNAARIHSERRRMYVEYADELAEHEDAPDAMLGQLGEIAVARMVGYDAQIEPEAPDG
jgi:hypothetical protein